MPRLRKELLIMDKITVEALFDLTHTAAGNFLKKYTYPWEVLKDIGEIILQIIPTLSEDYENTSGDIWIHKSAEINKTAQISGPCIIGANTVLRPGAFIRGNALIGDNCVIGNSCEIKNVIIFDNVQVPHFNYAGDSILGYRSHMGAGAVTSNVKSDKTNVCIKYNGGKTDTERKKAGAFLGDNVEIGCNSVLNPGTVICRNSRVYPLSSVRGVVPADSIYKNSNNIIPIERKEN